MRPRIVDFFNGVFDTSLFDWLIPYPAFIYAVAMFACMIVFVKRAKRSELDQYHALGAVVSAMIGGLIGARLLFVIIYSDRYPDLLNAVFAVSGATISWGAYAFGMIGFTGYLLIRRQTLFPYLDLLASVLGLGVCIGRISCFINGCDFGRLSSISWSVVYPAGSIPYIDQVRRGLITTSVDYSLPVHPVQLYLSLNGLLLFILFSLLWKAKRFASGTLFFLYWIVYSITRFSLEFLRWDSHVYYFNVFSMGQIITVITLLISLTSIVVLQKVKE